MESSIVYKLKQFGWTYLQLIVGNFLLLIVNSVLQKIDFNVLAASREPENVSVKEQRYLYIDLYSQHLPKVIHSHYQIKRQFE